MSDNRSRRAPLPSKHRAPDWANHFLPGMDRNTFLTVPKAITQILHLRTSDRSACSNICLNALTTSASNVSVPESEFHPSTNIYEMSSRYRKSLRSPKRSPPQQITLQQ